MPSAQNELTVCSYKLELDSKMKFAEAMRQEGTTASERIRIAIHQYLKDLAEGIEHPQLSLELKVKEPESKNAR
ncbi:hypothetical protein YA0783_24950 [Pseudomonas corrugata]|uniref:hypothetical protein n=1 Tax=Pseudomonas corrugata TaxID=47879 RepID=UPI0018E65D85|nr:hypothetical protein [Pseudomonas corrugata]MBI6621541.1 hypothetical protein [Pseudomonas corrugata]MBI6694224.1 hypothetical protein [Pseudomonas corrugata]